MTSTASTLAERYLATWNDSAAGQWSPQGRYADPSIPGQGHDGSIDHA